MKIEFLKEEKKVVVDGVEYVIDEETLCIYDINGNEAFAPIREEPECGQEYFAVTLDDGDGVDARVWTGCVDDHAFLNCDMLHLSKENAIRHAKVLLPIVKEYQWECT